jgi:hypothetical protein
MEKLHQNLLTERLEDAYLNGCSHITWNELYRWYGVQKIAAGTYRDLQTRWDELTDSVSGRLMMKEGRGGIYIFGEKYIKPVYPNSDE